MPYIELHARSAYSFLRGGSLPEHFVDAARDMGMPALGLCDRNGLYGSPRFSSAVAERPFPKKNPQDDHEPERRVRPIIGCELTMADGAVLPVLVETEVGYRHLCTLLSHGHLRAAKGEFALGWEELRDHTEGLVALTGDEEGPLQHAEDPDAALHRLTSLFGPQNVYVEVQRRHLRGETRRLRTQAALARAHGLPLLATNCPLYAAPAGRAVADMFTCLRHHTTLDQAGRLLSANCELRLKSPQEMARLFADLPEALLNTERLAERLQFSLYQVGYEFPEYPTPDGTSMNAFLRRVTFEGARRRYGPLLSFRARALLEKELGIIERLGFAGYFLIVWDLVQFCEANDILIQGRGSAANSAVCYCLGITAADAVKHGLLFERFLSEGRQGWPDIDLDLPSSDRRERVIQEIYHRYGREGAAMTANCITYRGRSAAREIGKVLALPADMTERFSRLFSSGDYPHTLELQEQMRQAGIPPEHPRTAAFVTLYQQVYGLPRHLGQHPGGMIISQGKLSRIVPLENASMPGRSIVQWDKEDCEDLKIIKVDLLGLGMMAVLQETITLSAERGRPMEMHQVPLDDAETFALMQRADTVGVFQIESRAQMATLPRLKPACFYDVVVEVAIIRPGPIQGDLVHPYLARRTGKERVTYFDDRLIPILKRTLGVPLFQEQLLRIAMVMADFTGAEAEELRRALSFHRSEERMAKVTKRLRERMEAKGVSAETVARIVQACGSFALYGFPESHAISFGILAYASAWYKVHRAVEFFASLLNCQPMGFYSSATLIQDARRHGLRTLPVCVEKSEWLCTVVDDSTIRLGFCVIRSLRQWPLLSLVSERARRAFRSVEDLRRRVPEIHRDEWRVLAENGALNALAGHRRAALWEVERELLSEDDLFFPRAIVAEEPAAECAELEVQTCLAGFTEPQVAEATLPTNHTKETNLHVLNPSYGDATQPPKLPPVPLAPMTRAERIRADFRTAGMTTGRHPMAILRPQLPDLWTAAELRQAANGTRVRTGGAVICRQRPGTAHGTLFLSLEDETGISNIVVTAELFERNRLRIIEEPSLIIEGRVQIHEGVLHLRALTIEPLLTSTVSFGGSHDFH